LEWSSIARFLSASAANRSAVLKPFC